LRPIESLQSANEELENALLAEKNSGWSTLSAPRDLRKELKPMHPQIEQNKA
jgi:hypothetical protein